MPSVPRLRRLGLLAVLLPPLLVLGAARGVVVCVAPGGHVQIESAANGCCAGPAPAPADGEVRMHGDGSDCGPCSDVRMAVADTRPSKRADGLRPPADAQALPPMAARELPLAAAPPPVRGRLPDRWLVPSHLLLLRSVALRC